jgi:hypothetical protein
MIRLAEVRTPGDAASGRYRPQPAGAGSIFSRTPSTREGFHRSSHSENGVDSDRRTDVVPGEERRACAMKRADALHVHNSTRRQQRSKRTSQKEVLY